MVVFMITDYGYGYICGYIYVYLNHDCNRHYITY